MKKISESAAAILAAAPKLPLSDQHWEAVVREIGLSKQQALVVELQLRGLSVKQIALVSNLGEGTVKDYLQRVAAKTGARGIRLAMHVVAVSLQIAKTRPKKTGKAAGIRSDGSRKAVCPDDQSAN
jgi:DNA-binding NarL/FixJ family response regulator